MEKILFLFAFIGVTFSMTPGTSYTYKYEGRLAMGIPQIRNKFTGIGIKANITLLALRQNRAIIKIDDAQVGDYIADAGFTITNPLGPLPVEYAPLQGLGQTLYTPIFVVLSRNKRYVMLVPRNEQVWITNLRKSIVQLFLITSIRRRLRKKNFSSDYFIRREPTIFGTCSVDYVSTLIDDWNTTENTSRVENGENAYLLKRTINFNRCSELVRLTHSSVGNLEGVSGNIFESIASRSSIMTAKVAGKGGNYKIIEADVQGYFSLNPFGVSTEKLMSLTNQTLVLISETQKAKRIPVKRPLRVVHSYNMEFESPFGRTRKSATFIKYKNEKDAVNATTPPHNILTGIPATEENVTEWKDSLDKLIEEVSSLAISVGPSPEEPITPLSTNEGKILTMLTAAVDLTKAIDLPRLRSLFEKYYDNATDGEKGGHRLELLIDVYAASGTSAPISAILEQIQNERITLERAVSIFMTLTNNFAATPILPNILTFIKTLDLQNNTVMTSNILINFATIVNKACIKKGTLPSQLFGRSDCKARFVNRVILPYFYKQLKSTTGYERSIYVQALANLGTRRAIRIIFKIIASDDDFKVKEVAIMSLKYANMDVISKVAIFNTLMPVVQNTTEDPLLRQYAIGVLVSWKPSSTWWYRLATSTRTEPSNSVGSYIYYLIKYNYHNTKNAVEYKAAKFFLPLTKYFPPVSYTMKYDAEDKEHNSNMFLNFAALKDDESTPFRALYGIFKATFGGIQFPFVEASVTTSIFNETERESSLFIRLFQNLQFMAPIVQKSNRDLNSYNFQLYKSLQKGMSLQFSKFYDPTPFSLFLPTELGVPFIAKMSTPTVLTSDGTAVISDRLYAYDNFLGFSTVELGGISFASNLTCASKVQTELQAILPWNEKIITSGVESLKSVKLPDIGLMISYYNNYRKRNRTTSYFYPHYEKEFTAAHISNIPYVARRSMYPGQIKYEDYETITVDGTGEGLNKERKVVDMNATGLNATILYEGDEPYPFTLANLYDNIDNPSKLISKIISPSAKLFSCSLLVNIGSSETKYLRQDSTYDIYSEKSNVKLTIEASGTGKPRAIQTNLESIVVSIDRKTKKATTDFKYFFYQLANGKSSMHCLNLIISQPVSFDFKTLRRAMPYSPIDHTFTGNVLSGKTNCADSLATVHGAFSLSEEKNEAILDVIEKELSINEESTATFENTPFFDQMNFTMNYKQPVPVLLENASYSFYDTIRGSQFPYVYHTYNVGNPEGRIKIQGERNVDATWNLRANLPKENVKIEHFEIPLIYKWILYLYGQNFIFY